MVQRAYGLVNHLHAGKVIHPNFMGSEPPVLGTLSRPRPIFLCLAIHLYPFLYNKLINVKYFPEFCEMFLQIIKPKGRLMEASDL